MTPELTDNKMLDQLQAKIKAAQENFATSRSDLEKDIQAIIEKHREKLAYIFVTEGRSTIKVQCENYLVKIIQ